MMWVSKPYRGKIFPSSPKRPDWFGSPLNLVSQLIRGVVSIGVRVGL